MLETHKGLPCLAFESPDDLRFWLTNHHASHGSFWMVFYKKGSGIPSITYQEALDELLCFGWIDSVPNKRDELSHRVLVSPRNPKSNWSKVNKDKVALLMASGRMQEPGLNMVALAQATGTWTALESVDNLEIPSDLMAALNDYPPALAHFEAFSNSARRGILEWIFTAKTAETRRKRILTTALMAQLKLKANHLPSTKIYQEHLAKQSANPST